MSLRPSDAITTEKTDKSNREDFIGKVLTALRIDTLGKTVTIRTLGNNVFKAGRGQTLKAIKEDI